MMQSGRVDFGAMEAVVFGKPASEAVAEEAGRLILHGRTSCIMLPTVMRWNKPVDAERQAFGSRPASLAQLR